MTKTLIPSALAFLTILVIGYLVTGQHNSNNNDTSDIINETQNSLQYYPKWPDLNEKELAECANYIKDNASLLKSDLSFLKSAYDNSQWAVASQIVEKYYKTDFKREPLRTAIFNCMTGYTFSDGEDYYFELDTHLSMLLISTEVAIEKRMQCADDFHSTYTEVLRYLDIILSSTLKSANKSFNPTFLYAAPLRSAMYKKAG